MPRPPRRFLLATNPTARIYLDLTTGAEVVEPAQPMPAMPRARKSSPPPPPPSSLAEAVAHALTELDFRFDNVADGLIRIPFQGKLCNADVQLEILEEGRSIRLRVDLQIAVPPRKEAQLLEAVQVLNRSYSVAQLLFNEQRRTIELYHPVFLADMEPTPAFLLEQVRVVMHNHDVLHYTLAYFLLQSMPPGNAEREARAVEEHLMMLWSPMPDDADGESPA
jgi:hypothetical protein